MWNKCEVTFDCFRDVGPDRAWELNNSRGALPEGWSLVRMEPIGRGVNMVFRVDGLNLTYEKGLHVHRSLERLGFR